MILFLDIVSIILKWSYAIVFLLILHTFLPLWKNLFIRILALYASSHISLCVIYANDLTNLLGALLGLAVYIAIFHRGSWVRKLTALLVFYPAVIAVNYLTEDIGSRIFFGYANVSSDLYEQWSTEAQLLSTSIFMVSQVIRLLFWIGAWYFLKKYLKQITASLTTRMWLVVDALMLPPLTAIFTIIYFMPNEIYISYPICMASLFSCFGCIYLVSYICGSIQTAYRAQELELKQSYYKDKLKDEERVRRIYHDMKNHLLLMEANLDSSKEFAGSVQALKEEIASYENYYHTGNEFLDVIILHKSRLAQEKQIDFNAVIQLGDSGFLEPLDISTIFGNALDNAIAACEKLPASMRLITVKASRIRDMLIILVENNMQPEALFDGNTTKKDAFLHGFGLANIKTAAEKYGGECTMTPQEGRFMLKVIIPIPQL